MTWVPARKGWMTKYGGKMYSVSCRQLGTEPTKEASWRAANTWWERKQAELDATAKVDDEPNARLRSAFAVQAAKDHFERTGELPRKVDVDLGDGRPVAYSFEGIQAEAEAKARGVIEFIDAAFAGIDPDRTVGGRAEEWYEAIRARANAGQTDVSRYGSYKRHLSLFTDWIGTTALLDSLTSKKVEGWYAELSSRVREGRYSPDYARSVFGASKRFIRWLAGHGLIPIPGNLDSRDFRFGKGKRVTRPDLFTKDEVKSLLEKAGDRLRLFLLLMMNCGMYQSDISDLGEDEVDWEARTIRRARSKTEAQIVTYTLWPPTFALLEQHRNRGDVVLNDKGQPRVLVTGDGKALEAYWMEDDKERRYDTVQSLYSRLKRISGIAKPMKNLRKTSASLLATHPQHKYFASYFLAHAPRSVADEFYVVPDDAQFFEALDWLGRQYGLIQEI